MRQALGTLGTYCKNTYGKVCYNLLLKKHFHVLVYKRAMS